MLIDLKDLKQKYNMNITGVIHVGAHYGEELPIYHSMGIEDIVLIEPEPRSLAILKNLVEQLDPSGRRIRVLPYALGSQECQLSMFTETHNQGQSNSLLKPKKHLEYYPDIQFDNGDNLMVEVKRMDNLSLNREKYNFLNCDVQGFEKEVLLGAHNSLKNIDYIYLEVNKEELYEGCAMIEDIDRILYDQDFYRAEVSWTQQGWGDALYIRSRPEVNVPLKFRPNHPFEYPKGNKVEFERWFHENTTIADLRGTSRVYLPIFWTAYHVLNNYGGNKQAIAELQEFIDKLPRNKQYFTICQYDDGPLVNFGNLDIMVYGMGGGRIDYPIPLIWDMPPINEEMIRPLTIREHTYNFIGRVTHPVREAIINTPYYGAGSAYVSTNPHEYTEYMSVLGNSVFTMCPRGYGRTSFRIAEALRMGSIPIYITDDKPIIPYNWDFLNYGIIVSSMDEFLHKLPMLSRNYINNLHDISRHIYKKYYTYQSLKKAILSLS